MAAEAGYLATAVGILQDNGSMRECVRAEVGVRRARHFSLVFSVHSTRLLWPFHVGFRAAAFYIHIKFTALIQMDRWDWQHGHTAPKTTTLPIHKKVHSGSHHQLIYGELGEHDPASYYDLAETNQLERGHTT